MRRTATTSSSYIAASSANGDVQVELDNERQITYAMELVRQAFAAKQPGGDTPAS